MYFLRRLWHRSDTLKKACLPGDDLNATLCFCQCVVPACRYDGRSNRQVSCLPVQVVHKREKTFDIVPWHSDWYDLDDLLFRWHQSDSTSDKNNDLSDKSMTIQNRSRFVFYNYLGYCVIGESTYSCCTSLYRTETEMRWVVFHLRIQTYLRLFYQEMYVGFFYLDQSNLFSNYFQTLICLKTIPHESVYVATQSPFQYQFSFWDSFHLRRPARTNESLP